MANNDDDDQWWNEDTFFPHLARTAITIIGDEENSNFVGVGQTPYWYLEAAKLLPNNQNNTFSSVAFSKHYIGDSETVGTALQYSQTEEFLKNVRNGGYAEYKAYLTEQGISPANIIHQYQTEGRKTVFVDYFSTGKGIASFLGFMAEWATSEGIPFESFDTAISCKLLHMQNSQSQSCNAMEIGPYKFKVENINAGLLIRTIATSSSPDDRVMPKVNIATPDFTTPSGKAVGFIRERLGAAVGKLLNTQMLTPHINLLLNEVGASVGI